MVKSENYITIQGWFINDLKLKGNDLLVYAIIYGFTQDGVQWYKGSLNYLAEWTNSTHQGIMKNLDKLVKSNLIIREDHTPTNWYRTNLDIVKDLKDGNSVNNELNTVTEPVNSVKEGCKLSLQNNINNNIIKNNKYKTQVELNSKVEDIISYFNNICNTNFKSTTAETKRLVKARLNEGFTVDDFKNVIECKYEDWGKKPVRFKTGQMSNEYLRPSTLFGNKFESYVYEANVRKSSDCTEPFNSVSVKADDSDRANVSF